MRLEKIKLAGFKSFVDPTAVLLPRNLTGIVGPNGCGKSNVIDAVRWVMGESSAKTLRGDSMSDVIFNGSTSRKPVGQASIELSFDNSDARAGGQYAKYSHISVKRQVSRDGQSSYFLNGVRCRRRDIMDLFLGTGLGPRSYAIIEQGMISRFIEAKPDDLRVFIEEAAGISKYKERRRETETRMRHTRENLERLNDLREEVSKQLKHLQRQAKTAERYQGLKQAERRLRAELFALRWRLLDQACNARSRRIQERETELQACLAEQRRIESEIEKSRGAHVEATDAFNRIQGVYYGLGGEIRRIEQAIEHANELQRQHRQDLEQVEHSLEQARGHQGADQLRLAELEEDLNQDEPLLEAARQAEESTAAQRTEKEQALSEWQTQWDRFNQRAAEPSQTAQVERARINQLERHVEQSRGRVARLQEEQGRLSDPRLEEEIALLAQQELEAEGNRERRQEQLSETQLGIGGLREELQRLADELNGLQHRRQRLDGRRASLEALQEAALGKQDSAITEWLDAQGLSGTQRLAEVLEVQAGWEQAVETVLGFFLESVCVDGLDTPARRLPEVASGALSLFDTHSTAAGMATPLAAVDELAAQPLGTKVESPWPLQALLGTVYAVEDLDAAWAMRDRLAPHESVISPEAVWLGPSWLRLVRDSETGSGVLQREQDLRQLGQEAALVGEQEDALRERIEMARASLQGLEARRDEVQAGLNQAARELTDLKTRLSAKHVRVEQMQTRRAQLEDEQAELMAHLETEEEQILEARGRLHRALEAMEVHAEERETLSRAREALRNQVEEARVLAQTAREEAHEIALRVERTRSTRISTENALERIRGQIAQLDQRQAELKSAREAGIEPRHALGQELEERLAERLIVEAQLNDARNQLEAIDAGLRGLEGKRSAAERAMGEVREILESLRIEHQEALIRRQTAQDQLDETGFERAAVLAALREDAEPGEWEEELKKVAQQIERLGAINLAAIDEFAEQSERMNYLDSQHADVTESLNTLEQAILKIDRETRARFKDTFEQVSTGFQRMFPRLFGGGHAFLELTGSDLLDTGITVMARPPGKRNSTIHLLSGGEKALTAIALVFAIFELNPAPFCMLDEVDAPLDEANVGRFCELVREMSARVQFIFITHNKATMEMANHLSGVTMQEPGVSRLVSVDIDEAVELAAVG